MNSVSKTRAPTEALKSVGPLGEDPSLILGTELTTWSIVKVSATIIREDYPTDSDIKIKKTEIQRDECIAGVIESLELEGIFKGHLLQLPCSEQGPFLPGHLLLILQLLVMPAGSSTSPCADKHHNHLVWTFPIGAAHSSIWKATKRTHTLNHRHSFWIWKCRSGVWDWMNAG